MFKAIFINIISILISLSWVYGHSEKLCINTINADCDCSKPKSFQAPKWEFINNDIDESIQAYLKANVEFWIKKDKDLIKRSWCCFTNGDIKNALDLINELELKETTLVTSESLTEDCVKFIKELYNKGYTNEALKFAKSLLGQRTSADLRIIKYFFESEAFAIDFFRILGIEMCDVGYLIFEYLAIHLDRQQDAEKFANELLDVWLNETEESLSHFLANNNDNKRNRVIQGRLKFARRIHISYYNQLFEKYINLNEKDQESEFSLKNFIESKFKINIKKIHSEDKSDSIIDMIVSRLYLDYRSNKEDVVNPELIGQLIETMLCEVSKNNEICLNILHAIALHAKHNPSFIIYVYVINSLKDFDDFIDDTKHGMYDPVDGSISMNSINIRNNNNKFKASIIHEMTHKLMDMLYDNSSKPYRRDNNEAKVAYQEALNELEANLDIIKQSQKDVSGNDYDAIDSLLSVREQYESVTYLAEFIARYPEALAANHNNSKVKRLMQPLADYWDKYIQPDLEKYINENGCDSTFVSDYSCASKS